MPLLWLSLAFLGGILLADLLGWPVSLWLALAGLALLALPLRRALARFFPNFSPFTPEAFRPSFLPKSPISYPVLVMALALGGARYQWAQPALTHHFIAWYNDQEAPFVVEGVIAGPPEQRDSYTNLRVRVEQLHASGELLFTSVEGLLLARASANGDWHYGERVRLEGWLHTPATGEEFSYQDYLAHQGIYSILYCRELETCVGVLGRGRGNPLLNAIYSLRERALAVLYQLFPDPEASLLAGILLGIEGGISQEVSQAFKDTGTAHIIAISGFNFAIVAGLFASLFGRWLGRWRGMLATLLGIALYAVLAGAGASVIRAAIMGSLSIFAMQMGRPQNGLNSPAFVAAVMALFNPNVPWDVSFQLSFMATLGLILYADPLAAAFLRLASRRLPEGVAQRLTGYVGEYFLFTLAAQLTTLPLTVYYFQRLSFSSLIANPLILPAQPPVMILGGLAVLCGLVYLPLGKAAAYLAWPFVAYTIRMVELLANFRRGVLVLGQASLWIVLLFYALLFAWTFGGERLKGWAARRQVALPPRWAGAGLLGLAVFTAAIWQIALAAPDGRLHLVVLEVGSGDGLLIQTPNGRNLLIDGGPSPSRLSDGLGRRLPISNRRLDYLVVAASGDEQLAALPQTVVRFPPEQVLWSGAPAGSYSAQELRERLAAAQIAVSVAQAGQRLDLGNGAHLEVLAASRLGAVLLLEWGNFRALLPIGMGFEEMKALQDKRELATATVLLLAGSGYAPLNPAEWIERWKPQVVLLSVAAGDPEGRPDAETLAAVAGYTLLRTDLNGWIELSTDGQQMWIEVEQH